MWETVWDWLPFVFWVLFITGGVWWSQRRRRGTIICPYCGGPGRVRLVGDGRLCACCQIRPEMQSEKGPYQVCDQCLDYGFSVFRKGVESERNALSAPADQVRREGQTMSDRMSHQTWERLKVADFERLEADLATERIRAAAAEAERDQAMANAERWRGHHRHAGEVIARLQRAIQTYWSACRAEQVVADGDAWSPETAHEAALATQNARDGLWRVLNLPSPWSTDALAAPALTAAADAQQENADA